MWHSELTAVFAKLSGYKKYHLNRAFLIGLHLIYGKLQLFLNLLENNESNNGNLLYWNRNYSGIRTLEVHYVK